MAFTPIDEEEIIDEPVAEEAKPRFIPIEDDEFFGIGGEEEAPEPVIAQETTEPVEAPKSRFTPISEEEFFGLPEPTEPIPVTGEEGFLRQAADVPLKIGESINTSLRALTDLFGADNAISQNLTQNADWYRSLLSAQAIEDEQEIGRILQEAENEGVLDQLGAGLEAFSVAPVDFVASGVGSLATFVATGVAGRAAALAGAARAGLTGAKAAQFVQRGVQATQLATGAGMGAGIVKGEIYQSVKDEMLAQGKTEEEARQIATEAQSYGGKNLDQILIGAGLGTIDAFTGAEKIISKVLTKGGLAPNVSRVGNILKNGISEGAPEFIQAAQEKFASNLALQREGVNVSLTQGVFSQGALEGLVGVGLGAGAGAIEPRTQPATKEESLAAASETQDVARQNKDVAPETAALVEGQAESVIQEQAETPEQRVVRLQKEAAAAAGIELEEEVPVSGLPPQPVTTTAEAPITPAVAPVEPVVEPVVAEPQPSAEVAPADQPSPNLAPRAEAAVEARPVRQEGEPIGDFRNRKDAWDEQYGTDRRGGRTHNDDGTPYQPTVFDETISQVNASGVIGTDEDAMSAAIGTRSELEAGNAVKDLVNAGWVWDAAQNRMVNPQNPEQRPSDGLVEARQAPAPVTLTAPAVAPPAEVEPEEGGEPITVYRGELPAIEGGRQLADIQDIGSIMGIQDSRVLAPFTYYSTSEQDARGYLERDARMLKEYQDRFGEEEGLKTFRTLHGFDPRTEGQVISKVIRPKKTFDMTEMGVMADQFKMVELISKEMGYPLPENWKWKDVRPEVNKELDDYGFLIVGGDGEGGADPAWQYFRNSTSVVGADLVARGINKQRKDDVRGSLFAQWLKSRGYDSVAMMHDTEAGPVKHILVINEDAAKSQEGIVQQVEKRPEPTTVAPTPNLEPLRRVARAEQAPEDVPSLVDAGLVEVYKDQPVLTETGIAQLPEAERPRLTPEARKIQIDTGSNEVVAEAIAKGLRIGVDQVGTGVRMPAGWTLVEDIYVPPAPQEVAPEATTFAKGEMVRVTNRVPTYEGGRVVGGRDELVAGSVTRIMPDGKVEVRLQRGGYQTLAPNEVQKIERPAPEVRESRREDVRLNPLGYDISTVVEDIKAGRTDGPLKAVNNVVKEATALRDRVKAEAERRQRPRARGKAAILERIARERSGGKLSEETARALTDFVNSIREEAIGDTAISIKGGGGVSNFDFGQSLVSFFLTQDQPKVGARVGVHEFWHGLSRFLPKAELESMSKDYTRELTKYIDNNPWFLAFVGRYSLTPEQYEAYKIFNPEEAETKLVPVQDSEGNVVKYQIRYDAENYRYIMLDEWIAEKMTDLVESRQAVPNTFMGKLAKIIKEFMAQIQAKLGRDSYQSFYNLVTDPNQKIDLQRMGSVARPFQIYQPQDYNYAEDVSDQIRYAMRQREDINREYTPNTDEERKAFDKASTNKILARSPQLAVAAVRLKNGQITAGDYADLVDAIDPFTAKGADPIPTDDKIKQYIQSDKVGRVGFLDEKGNPRLQEGSEYEFRIDINTYNRSTTAGDTVYNITAHESVPETSKRVGEAYAYVGVAKVTNPTFMTRAISGKGSAAEIAAGAGKFPLATVKGNYEPITELPTDINDPNVWTEVGYNPIRSSYFVDVRSKDAVVGGTEAIMVGSRVFVKNAKLEARPTGITYGKAYNPLGLEPEPKPSFVIDSPEAKTLSNLKASMAKVDAASEAKGGKPTTQKVSEIAANWMEQGGDERALQDAITENTNLSPVNAAKVANAIAKQYDIQQSIATAFIETQTGLSVEALPEGVTLPKEVDPDRPKPVMSRLFDVFMGVRVPPVKIQVNEKAALKDQIRLKAAANRAAKAEQKRTAEEVVEIIKAMELLGPVRPKQVQALAKRAARVIWTSEKSVEAFSEYAAKVVENANYDADLREAKDAQKRAKQLSTQKKVAMGPQREVLEDVSKIPVNKLDDPRMFAEAVNYYLRGFKAVLSPDYVVIPDAEMESYLSGAQSETQRNQRDLDREANERLAKKYGIEPDQVDQMMESIDIIKQIEAQENRDALENLLTEKAVETQQGLRGYDTDNLRADQRSIVSSMLKVDPKALDPEERQRFIRITNNIIYNNQTNGAEYFVAVAKGQQSAREAAQDPTMVAKNRAWINLLPRFISERMQRGWALELQSIADTFRNAFGKGAMAKMYDAMGMLDLNLGFTKANNTIDEIQEKIAEFHRNLEKKYKAAARNQDGLLAEGVVGFLIQSVPKKDEVTSINQRRDLIRQDIANRRRSTTEPDRVAMADRIETILNQIDGDSVEAILNNMKREFRPNYESLIWYKDTLLPQYKDFLKSFDENFNDQANNYENPNYLTIGFTSAGPSLAITPEEQSLFYDQVSLRPKQSAYTIKRVDYTEIPKDRTTKRPKEIEFNLRRNVFNGLSDQINKAYTSSGWQRIASFMKTPEAEVVFGGAANKDFFIERLNRLRLSRMRRGSMGSGGAIEKAVDSLSVISRKLGTGIALGGIYQWIKQPPDQLITAWGSGGRGDLLAKNIAPKTQKLARTLLNKFSIGRRGDASAGYKYINQMEGHQNRLERYFSESKWDQAKEQAGKIADVWMIALKSSDFLAASAAWMTYYEGELNKQDIKIDDWSKEADLIESDPARRQAAAFAEQMTDIYQGSSDPTSMATFAQSGKTGWENLVKAIFVPFNSFAIQQRMRLYSDARDAISGSKSGVGGLSGTIGGLILFHTTKRYVIPAISGAGIGVLYGLMGVDMEEPDEEKQKEEANKNWRQFLADITGNLLVGGTPQIVESKFIDAMNRASYLVSLQLENDSILNEEGEVMSYDQYSKERSPFYRYQSFDNAMSLGMLEIGLGQAEQVALQTKMLATPEEMEMYTPEEQRLLYFSALSEWLYMMRLNDADFARLVGKARRDMMSAAKDREKEIKRIRSGR